MRVRSLLAFALVGVVTLILAGSGLQGRGVAAGSNVREPIYVTFFSHNEDETYWLRLLQDPQEYLTYRSDLIAKIKLLRRYHAILNWETGYVVLRAMKKYETGDLLKATNGKNVLRWMVEDMGMKVDPHGHLAQYNYADLAYLIGGMGVRPSSVLGGFELFRCGQVPGTVVQTDWRRSLEIGGNGAIRGRYYPQCSWRPAILGQPGMIGHVFEEFSSGVWRPQEGGDFLVHQPSGRFICIGQGYPHNAAMVSPPGPGNLHYTAIDYIRELADKIRSGQAPAGRIYTCSLHMIDNPPGSPWAVVEKTLNSLQDLVRSGRVVYQDYESVARLWRVRYHEQPNRYGIENFSIYPELRRRFREYCRHRAMGPPPGRGRMPGTGPPNPGSFPPDSNMPPPFPPPFSRPD